MALLAVVRHFPRNATTLEVEPLQLQYSAAPWIMTHRWIIHFLRHIYPSWGQTLWYSYSCILPACPELILSKEAHRGSQTTCFWTNQSLITPSVTFLFVHFATIWGGSGRNNILYDRWPYQLWFTPRDLGNRTKAWAWRICARDDKWKLPYLAGRAPMHRGSQSACADFNCAQEPLNKFLGSICPKNGFNRGTRLGNGRESGVIQGTELRHFCHQKMHIPSS